MNKDPYNYLHNLILKGIILPLLGSIMLFSCENDIDVIKTFATSNVPKQSAQGIETIFTDSGKVQLKVVAPKLDYYQKSEGDTYYEFTEGIKVYFYNDDLTVKSKLTANYAIYYEQKNLWEARNNVVAINENGDILYTELLYWDQEKGKIYTDKLAKVKEKDSEILGEGFEADQNFTSWEFKKVTGIINIEEENTGEL